MLLAVLCFIVVIIRIIIYRSSQKQKQFVAAADEQHNTNYIICIYIYKRQQQQHGLKQPDVQANMVTIYRPMQLTVLMQCNLLRTVTDNSSIITF